MTYSFHIFIFHSRKTNSETFFHIWQKHFHIKLTTLPAELNCNVTGIHHNMQPVPEKNTYALQKSRYELYEIKKEILWLLYEFWNKILTYISRGLPAEHVKLVFFLIQPCRPFASNLMNWLIWPKIFPTNHKWRQNHHTVINSVCY